MSRICIREAAVTRETIFSEFMKEFDYVIFALYKIKDMGAKKVSELTSKINAEKEAV